MEVAIARVYNWEVVQKRKDRTNDEREKKNSGGQADLDRDAGA